LQKIEDYESRQQAVAERSLTRCIQGGCRFPVGAIAITRLTADELTLHASVFSSDGSNNIKMKEKGLLSHATEIGIKLANRLNRMGVGKFAAEWRNAINQWNMRL
jgi:hydroxymethylbilane synthase